MKIIKESSEGMIKFNDENSLMLFRIGNKTYATDDQFEYSIFETLLNDLTSKGAVVSKKVNRIEQQYQISSKGLQILSAFAKKYKTYFVEI
jgi:predicted transcriptional regulator